MRPVVVWSHTTVSRLVRKRREEPSVEFQKRPKRPKRPFQAVTVMPARGRATRTAERILANGITPGPARGSTGGALAGARDPRRPSSPQANKATPERQPG